MKWNSVPLGTVVTIRISCIFHLLCLFLKVLSHSMQSRHIAGTGHTKKEPQIICCSNYFKYCLVTQGTWVQICATNQTSRVIQAAPAAGEYSSNGLLSVKPGSAFCCLASHTDQTWDWALKSWQGDIHFMNSAETQNRVWCQDMVGFVQAMAIEGEGGFPWRFKYLSNSQWLRTCLTELSW